MGKIFAFIFVIVLVTVNSHPVDEKSSSVSDAAKPQISTFPANVGPQQSGGIPTHNAEAPIGKQARPVRDVHELSSTTESDKKVDPIHTPGQAGDGLLLQSSQNRPARETQTSTTENSNKPQLIGGQAGVNPATKPQQSRPARDTKTQNGGLIGGPAGTLQGSTTENSNKPQLIGGQAGVNPATKPQQQSRPARDTKTQNGGLIGGPAGTLHGSTTENSNKPQLIGGQAGINPATKPQQQSRPARDTKTQNGGLIGGPAGTLHGSTTENSNKPQLIGGQAGINPATKPQQQSRPARDTKTQSGGLIGGPAGTLHGSTTENSNKPQIIGGQAGINPATKPQQQSRPARDTKTQNGGLIGGPAGTLHGSTNKPQLIGGQAGVNPATKPQQQSRPARDTKTQNGGLIGGPAGTLHGSTTENSNKPQIIGGQAGVNPATKQQSRPTRDLHNSGSTTQRKPSSHLSGGTSGSTQDNYSSTSAQIGPNLRPIGSRPVRDTKTGPATSQKPNGPVIGGPAGTRYGANKPAVLTRDVPKSSINKQNN